MEQNQRNYYKTNITALNLTAALVKTDPSDGNDEDAKWPCLETESAKGLSTETSSTTSRDVTSNASDHKRKPFCTIGKLRAFSSESKHSRHGFLAPVPPVRRSTPAAH